MSVAPFDLKTVEALAPDQASLAAASKLTKAAKWGRLEYDGTLYWGECQGSGANPYRVIADAGDNGYKCTCPSRKFPCKHTLALMWLAAASPALFQAAAVPEWVSDWLGRRRKSGSGGAAAASSSSSASSAKNIAAAVNADAAAEAAAPEDPKAAARREAARVKRAGETRAAIADALDELDQWVTDQLRLGLTAFIDNASERCRRIAARLVDQKAAALASRLDEMPARLLALAPEERPEAAIRELGKLVLLGKAWRAQPDEPEIRRQVATSETREQVLNDPATLVVQSRWEVLGEKIQTRRDGLVSHATWLMNQQPDPAQPPFALLLDFYPASAGRRTEAFYSGEQLAARLAFYPSPLPLRALLVERAPVATRLPWPPVAGETGNDPLAAGAPFWNALPWGLEYPLSLPPGRIARGSDERDWWLADTPSGQAFGAAALPLARNVPLPVLGMALAAATGLWNGTRLDLLAAHSPFGRLDLA